MRRPDYMVREKRKKTVRLDEKAYLILKEIKKSNKAFDFSDWVSTKLKVEFTKAISKETFIEAEIRKEELMFKEIASQHYTRMQSFRSQLASQISKKEVKEYKEQHS